MRDHVSLTSWLIYSDAITCLDFVWGFKTMVLHKRLELSKPKKKKKTRHVTSH